LFLKSANCSDLACLRYLSISDIQLATEASYDDAYLKKQYAYGAFYWGPVIDGQIIQNHPFEEFRDGHFAKVPLMVDHNFAEGFRFTNVSLQTEQDVISDLSALWHEPNHYHAEMAMSLYPESSYNSSTLENLVYLEEIKQAYGVDSLSDAFAQRSALFGDAIVNCPTTYIARSVADAGIPVYKMVFNAGHQTHGATSNYLFSDEINGMLLSTLYTPR
jgi:carboxylesterase type B